MNVYYEFQVCYLKPNIVIFIPSNKCVDGGCTPIYFDGIWFANESTLFL